jgi:hypothetical protein
MIDILPARTTSSKVRSQPNLQQSRRDDKVNGPFVCVRTPVEEDNGRRRRRVRHFDLPVIGVDDV